MPSEPSDVRELHALLSLLESEGERSRAILTDQMRAFPAERLHRLAGLAHADSYAATRLNLVQAEREVERLRDAFIDWLARGADLEEGVLLVARTGYPFLDTSAVSHRLDAMAEETEPDLPRTRGPEALDHLKTVLRDRFGFRGNVSEYDDPDNSYLNRVLERRTGLPISLAVVWILLGQRLDLPIAGIALPAHFIAGFATSTGMVYVDPFRGGRTLGMGDVRAIVSAAGRVLRPGDLRPATSLQIVQRMVVNLVHAYEGRGDGDRAALAKRYLEVL